MTKDEVTKKLAEELGVPVARAEKIVASVSEVFLEVLLHDGKLRLQGFGTFGMRTNPQRKIRNSKNKRYVTERNHGPYFKPSPQLKRRCRVQSRRSLASGIAPAPASESGAGRTLAITGPATAILRGRCFE